MHASEHNEQDQFYLVPVKWYCFRIEKLQQCIIFIYRVRRVCGSESGLTVALRAKFIAFPLQISYEIKTTVFRNEFCGIKFAGLLFRKKKKKEEERNPLQNFM